MNELTLEIIGKIIRNCKDRGTFLGNTTEDKDTEFSVWEINIYNEDKKEFNQYNLVEMVVENKYDNYTEYYISLEEDSNIINDFYIANDSDYDDYNLDNWLNEYGEDLETNEEVIELVEKYAGKELRIENKGN